MKPEWLEIIPKRDLVGDLPVHFAVATLGMNVPGDCIINYSGYMVFVPGVAIVNEGQQPAFVSTVTEDMDRALGPLRQLIALFQGVPGFVPPKPD